MIHGAVQMFLAIALGAFGAHGLKAYLDSYGLSVWQTAVQYHMIHGLALVTLGLFQRATKNEAMGLYQWIFGAGILLFSGSLYLLALTGIKFLGAITPLGGLLFLFGWAHLAWKAPRLR
jgi:uncharacterized membrane protein YgdD (TMEM256/DUF423 family)